MRTWQIMALAGTLIFLFAGVLPLFSVQFILTFSISLIDLYGWIGRGLYAGEDIPEWSEAFSGVAAGFFIIAVLFPMTVIIGLASVIKNPKLSLIAGFLGCVYSLGAIITVLRMMALIAELGGSFGGMAASFMQIGYGVYVSLLGSVILLVSYPVAIRKGKVAADS